MPEVAVSLRVNRAADDVYKIVADMEAYPTYMPSVERVTVIDRSDGRTVTEWVTRLSGSRLSWQEEDLFDPAARQIAYHLVKGDLRQFEGEWTVTAQGENACDVRLTARFEFGLPMLAALLNPVGKVVLRQNVDGMLKAIAEQAQQTTGNVEGR